MKHKWIIPLAVLVLFSLSCSFTKLVKDPTTTPTLPVVEEATKAPLTIPTKIPRPTATEVVEPTEQVEPTEVQATASEEASDCPAYYTETFDQPTDCWDFSNAQTVTDIHNPDKVSFGPSAGYMDINVTTNEELYLYFLNANWDYPSVVVEAEVVNHKGTNKNGIVLACYVNENGWYEVRLETGGFFQVYQYDANLRQQGKNPYTFIHQGGTKGIRIGYDRINTMTWECNGKDLTFDLNGEEIWTTTLREVNAGGGVGIGATVYKDNYPVHIGFESLTIREP